MPAIPLTKTFTSVLQFQEKGKRNMKIRPEGETVTSDEILQIVKEQQKKRREEKSF